MEVAHLIAAAFIVTFLRPAAGQDVPSSKFGGVNPKQLPPTKLSTSTIYEHSFTIIIAPRTTDCYFFPLKQNNIVDVEYIVQGASANNAQPLRVQVSLKDFNGVTQWASSDDVAGEIVGQIIRQTGDYQLCFGNPSLTTESRVYWDIAIEGQKEDAPTHQLADVSLEDFTNGSQAIATSLTKIRFWSFRAFRDLGLQKAAMTADINYVTALKTMIDHWSLAHVVLVVSVCLGQVFFIRRLFRMDRFDNKRFSQRHK